MERFGNIRTGDKVILPENTKVDDGEKSPHWGGKYGKIVGTVDCIRRDDGWAKMDVVWNNGFHYAGLPAEILKKYNPAMEMALEKSKKTYDMIAPYKKYIGLLALALVLDHFILGGKCLNKFKVLASKFVTTIQDTLETFIDKLFSSDQKGDV